VLKAIANIRGSSNFVIVLDTGFQKMLPKKRFAKQMEILTITIDLVR